VRPPRILPVYPAFVGAARVLLAERPSPIAGAEGVHEDDNGATEARSGATGAEIGGQLAGSGLASPREDRLMSGAFEHMDLDDEDDSVEPAGKFRVYLGAVAGVGKTWAMLDEGWRRYKRGADVMIGFVETHGREMTAAQIRDLPIIPRKVVDYRGTRFEEMDLAAVLARKPEVALIDELAHTNVPGSGPHAKRWEDVLEILEAGIGVVSTVNIQHLESVADAVQQITGVTVGERVPDWVVRRADQLELIDSSPEQLRRRMLHGNVYPPAKIPDALNSFFRYQNLVALRELALRFVADETEEELLAFLVARHPDIVWDTAERIMVAVNAAAGTDAVFRRAARIALRAHADLQAVYVVGDDTSRPASRQALEVIKQLSGDLGASWHEITSDDPATALVQFAKDHQITQIVLGASRRSRWEQLTSRASVVQRVLRFAREESVDVHVIARYGKGAPLSEALVPEDGSD
jgi:two-component system sensor histidine kinase KdpD